MVNDDEVNAVNVQTDATTDANSANRSRILLKLFFFASSFAKNGYSAHVLKNVRRQVERSMDRRGSLGRRRRGGTQSRATSRGGVQGADWPDREPSGILLLPYSRFHDGLICFQFDTIGTKFGTFGI